MKPDCYDYVRKTYGVPAFIGARVRFSGKREGVIVSARTDLHYIHVRLDGQKFSVPAHPTSDVEYLTASPGDVPAQAKENG